MKSLSTRKW